MIVLSTRANGEKPLGEVFISVTPKLTARSHLGYFSVEPQANSEKLLGLLLCRGREPKLMVRCHLGKCAQLTGTAGTIDEGTE